MTNRYLEKIAELREDLEQPRKGRARVRAIIQGGLVGGLLHRHIGPVSTTVGGSLAAVHGYNKSMKNQGFELKKKASVASVVREGWKHATPTQKLSTAVGGLSTGVGIAGLASSGGNIYHNAQGRKVEEKSLNELKKIRTNLTNQPPAQVNITAGAVRALLQGKS